MDDQAKLNDYFNSINSSLDSTETNLRRINDTLDKIINRLDSTYEPPKKNEIIDKPWWKFWK